MIRSNIRRLCIWLFLLCSFSLGAQEINPDSLERVYLQKSFKPHEELSLLLEIASYSQDPQKKLDYSLILKERLDELDSSKYLLSALFQEGQAYFYQGDYLKALPTFQEISTLAREEDDKTILSLSNLTIGEIYIEMGETENAIEVFTEIIPILRSLEDEYYLALALLNAGEGYRLANKYDSAELYFLDANSIFKKIEEQEGLALGMGNLGMVYARQEGKSKLAEANLEVAITLLEEIQNFYAISEYMIELAILYIGEGRMDEALNIANKALSLASDYELLKEMSAANGILVEIYESQGDDKNALRHYKAFIAQRDSMAGVDKKRELEKINQDYLFNLEKEEKEEYANYLKISGGVIILVMIMTTLLYRRNVYINKTRKRLEIERAKSNDLLLNILPEETAEELKANGTVKAKKYNSVTVLFSDFKNFTKYAEALPPEELVQTIDTYFSEFDKIMERYHIEKIKTIGDAYMCASGLPEPNKDHAHHMILAAQAMLAHVEKLKEVHNIDEARFDISIGIHTGPVVAGVVGERKFAYDIWGDTVNIASRMESTCEPGKINISSNTFALVKDKFEFESRGTIEVKNRGAIEMYYLGSTTTPPLP